MTEEKIQDFRERTKPRLRAYLKASHLKAMMETLSLNAQQAMDALRVPPEEQAKYAAML